MTSEHGFSDTDHSQAIMDRLLNVLCNKWHERELLDHIENITMCGFSGQDLMLIQVIDEVSSSPESVSAVIEGYQVWKAVGYEDRLL